MEIFRKRGCSKTLRTSTRNSNRHPGIILYTLEARINGVVIIGLSMILMIYSQLIQKRMEFGAINRTQWLAFKKYVKEASVVQLPRPELDQWERFLAYAIPIKMVDVMIEQFQLIYDANTLKDKRLSLLHGDNIDRTLYWINSLSTGDGLRERLLGPFRFPDLKL